MSTITLSLAVLLSAAPASNADDYFRIRVVDAQTGRGVPLVEVRTVGGNDQKSGLISHVFWKRSQYAVVRSQ